MMKKTLWLVLAGLLSVLICQPARAGTIGIGMRAAYVTDRQTDASSGMTGLFTRIHDGVLGLEAAVDYRRENLGSGISRRTWPVTASLAIYPLPEIYALAGLGWYNTTLDLPKGSQYSDRTKTRLGYHLGAGVELAVLPSLRLIADGRYHFVDYKFRDIPSEIGHRRADFFSLNAGVAIFLPPFSR